MDEFVRQLTHDNQQMADEWPTIFDNLHASQTDQPDFKIKIFDALVDYILADHEEVDQIKVTFIEMTLKEFREEPRPALTELVRIFCRLLDVENLDNLLIITFVRTMFYQYQLGTQLVATSSMDLIDRIIHSLQKHSFSDQTCTAEIQDKWKDFLSRTLFSQMSSDTNKLNVESAMNQARNTFQQLYSYAARNSQQSKVWSQIESTLTRTLPTLFDVFPTPTDLQFHLKACAEPPISDEYVKLLAKSCQRQVNLFKQNCSEVYRTIEKLVCQNRIEEAEHFVDYVLVTHYKSIDNLEELLQMLIRLCPLVNQDSRDQFCKDVISPLSYKFSEKKPNKKYAGLFFDLLLATLDLTVLQAPPCAYRILEISEFYPWKQLGPQITHLVQSCVNYDQLVVDSFFSDLDRLTDILELIEKRAEANPTIFQATHDVALQAVFKWSSIVNPNTEKPFGRHVFKMGQKVTELIDVRQVSADVVSRLLEILRKRIDNNDETNDLDHVDDYFLMRIAFLLPRTFGQLKSLPLTVHQQLAGYFLAAFECTLTDENGGMTFAQSTSMSLWFQVGQCIDNDEKVRPYEPCADRLFQLVCDEGEESLQQWWYMFWSVLGMKYPNVAADHIVQFLHDIIDRKQSNLIMILPVLYEKRPEPFHNRLDDLITALCENNAERFPHLSSLFIPIAKAHPELLTAAQIDLLLSTIINYTGQMNSIGYFLRIVGYVASAQPRLFDKHRGELLRLITEKQSLDAFDCLQQYLIASVILSGEEKVDEYLTLLINLLKKTKNLSPDLQTQIFHTCQLIGVRHKASLATKRNEFLPFESNSTCRMLIEFIDGKQMSEEYQAAINHTLTEIAQIEQRVGHTERDVHKINQTMKRQELNITNLGARVDTVDNHVNDISEKVELHAREIERIDAKTLSYVPSEWGRSVCTLLNVRATNDWRLLGKRFGYSTSELKHWAMQLDPSMSLLNEWFMTHKADEATYGLVKMLKEIGREDAEQIIRKAVATAGELIPDDLPMEIKRLPPVFLSYQWGSQKMVSILKSNLEEAGYACWMDTGQMGGGDKLFAKIDAGIRGAKVVVCCMNPAYAQSDNCSREVHLTISTGKPLIPLQMEKQTWPPEGALGPIMSEYLYIRFFDRKAGDANYWPADKFVELLGQIRYHVAPDPDMITEKYRNWFVPRVDNLIFLQPTVATPVAPADPKKEKASTNPEKKKTTVKDDIPLVVTHPQLMISYQWDYQKDIVLLYEKLTKLGYRCWLDIFQMGGGDSLFEKIDTGIRNAKCVLSCVTPKYTKSINCRREMALADALQKPIVPLLLEETSTWPPAGPMSMVFAEKIYIDFRRADVTSERWIGKEFESVLARLKQTIPEVQTERPQRHLLDMQRPTTATKRDGKPKRVSSAPVTPQSRACSIM